MINNHIRPLALAVIKKNNKILVQLGYDNKKNEKFYRLPGGGIKFGETGASAIKREIKEEFSSGIDNIKFFGILENIFIYNGKKGHEVVMIYKADLIRKSLYNKIIIQILDNKNVKAVWEDIEILKKSNFYPNGIKDYFRNNKKI